MSGANGMSWFDAFVNAALMSLCLGWLFFDEGDTLVETEGETIDWDGDAPHAPFCFQRPLFIHPRNNSSSP